VLQCDHRHSAVAKPTTLARVPSGLIANRARPSPTSVFLATIVLVVASDFHRSYMRIGRQD